MNAKVLTAVVLMVAAAAVGCNGQSTPSPLPEAQVDSKTEQVAHGNLTADDFCADGVRLGSNASELAAVRKSSLRQLGGADYQSLSAEFYLSADGRVVAAIEAPITSLCSYEQRVGSAAAKSPATRIGMEKAFGSPTAAATDGDEFLFYSDKDRKQYLVLRFRDGVLVNEEVQVLQAEVARRQYASLLGTTKGPGVVTLKDASLGPLALNMDSEAARKALGVEPSEGDLRPYGKFIWAERKVEIHYAGGVKAIFNHGDATLKTPRGVTVGDTPDAVRTAYGEPRVARDRMGNELWSYEGLRDGVGLVFTFRGGKVTGIALVTADYEFRPEAK